jgi:hypothetical protein
MATEPDVPIACTLSGDAWTERIAEWQSFYRSAVTETEVSPGSVRLRLAASDAVLVAAVSLSQREKECCAFFDFAIAMDAHDRWLVARVPPDAEAVLDSFICMLAEAASDTEG